MADNYIIELRLNTNDNDIAILNKCFNIATGIYNKLVSFANKQLKRMKENKTYQNTLKQYLYYKDINDKANVKLYSNLLNEIRMSYSLSEYQFHSIIKTQQNMYKEHIDSNTSQKLASTVWKAVESVLFKKGQYVHYKKFNTLLSLEGKSNKQGIRFKKQEEVILTDKDKKKYEKAKPYEKYNIKRLNKLKQQNRLEWNGLIIPVKIRHNDLFVKESLENNIKYCRIVRKSFKNGYKYFLQLIISGLPPAKRIHGKVNYGNLRHIATTPNNRIGIDIGTSTIAVCSKNKVILRELAINSKQYDREIYKLQRKLERSKRATNPNNFNLNGTIKKGLTIILPNGKKKKEKLKWSYSKNYYKTLNKLKNLYRLKSVYITLEHNKLAKEIISLGNEIYVETMRFNALAKRATFKEGEELNSKGKHKKKKRYGKSINNKAPSKLLTIIETKLSYEGLKLYKVNTRSFKASQYNHIEDKYIKKELNERVNIIDGKLIQRDLYSSFLLMNSKKNLKETDRKLCIDNYDNFKINHDKEIREIIDSGIKVPYSFGIKKFK